jgi:cyclohexadienyl dehydratase
VIIRYLVGTLLVLTVTTLQAAELYDAIGARLALMQEVAAYKWIHGQPIEVPEREAIVIENAIRSGLDHGITVNSSRLFFTAQIEAAKDIQECWFRRWEQEHAPTEAADLDRVVRPRLLALGADINRLLATETHDEFLFMARTKTDCLSGERQQNVFNALKQIQVYPDRLSQIRDSGMVRIGTTGDYAPFSFAEDGDEPEGIDIDMANALAAYLKADLVLVKTSWPTLMQDLAQGRYDIAMSGVSRIPAREELAYFSQAYHIGGKTPVARCSDVSDLGSLEAIDQPGRRVIVNPGGTNERFLDAHIRQATKVLHNDNRTIFGEILQERADVMFTDLIEAQLQSAKLPGLCMAMPTQTLTYQEKAYMMPKDPGLLAEVNRWLKETQASGKLAETFASHLN